MGSDQLDSLGLLGQTDALYPIILLSFMLGLGIGLSSPLP